MLCGVPAWATLISLMQEEKKVLISYSPAPKSALLYTKYNVIVKATLVQHTNWYSIA